jgi:hypothetical protein
MFWDALYSALKIMTHWETHFVVLGYLLLMLTPMIIIFLVLKKSHALNIQYFRKLFLPLLEAVAIAVSVLTLFPIILGVGENVAWNFPLRIMQLSPLGFVALIGSVVVLAYLIDVISVLRRLRTVKTLVLGGVCLIFVRIFLNLLNPVIDIEIMDLVPGFWFICGIIVISGVLAKLGYFVFESFVRVIGSKFDLREDIAELLIIPVIATLGFLPVFVYGAWLA